MRDPANGLGFGKRSRRSSSRASSDWASIWSRLRAARPGPTSSTDGLRRRPGSTMAFLKVDPSNVDALILSHGHYDHFGGLVPLLTEHRDRMRKDLTLYVGGEDTFCHRWRPLPAGTPEDQRQTFGVLDRRVLDKAKVKVVMAEAPMVIGDHAFTTGAIARSGFETVQPAAQVEARPAKRGRLRRLPLQPRRTGRKIVPDQFWYRARHLLQRQGPRAGGDLLLRPRRHRQHRQGGPGRCPAWRRSTRSSAASISPRPRARRRPDRRSTQGDQPRLPRPHALQRQGLHPPRRCGHAGEILPPSTGSRYIFGA